MPRLGLISDTHGLLRPEALAALAGCGHIVHAGDIGDPAIVPRLEAIAPVSAIRGNVDVAPWARIFPSERIVVLGEVRIFVLHDIADLGRAPAGIDMIVSGHSHRPRIAREGGVLHVNPGSAGPRRFRLPVTLATMEIGAAGLGVVQLHDLVPRPSAS